MRVVDLGQAIGREIRGMKGGGLRRIAALLLTIAVGVASASTILGRTGEAALSEPAMMERPHPLVIGVAAHVGIERLGYGIGDTARALADLHLDRYRADLGWAEFQPSGADGPVELPRRLRDFATVTNARALYILGHPHPKIAGGALPSDPETRSAFARYAAAAVDAVGPGTADYEIWNEWNNEKVAGRAQLHGAGDDDDPRSAAVYAQLARAGTEAIRHRRSASRILVGADGMDPDWSWISAVVRDGGADRADGVSVHVYNHCERADRRTGDGAIDKMEALRAVQHRDGWSGKPIWVTELGWPTPTGVACGVSLEQQADNMAQWLFWAAATPWVGGVYLYQLKDQGMDPHEIEDNFGLLDYSYRPKPAACAVREAAAVIRAGLRWGVDRSRAGVTLIRVDLPDGPRLIAWSLSSGTVIRAKEGALAYRSICGAAGRSATVEIGARPVLIDLRGVAGGVRSLMVN